MRLSIVIPAYNEGQYLDPVIRRLHATVYAVEPSSEIIIVNNGSSDDTPRIANELAASLQNIRVVNVFPNQGYGNGILSGMSAAYGDILGWVHADEQTNPEDVVRIYQKICDEELDLCKAVRTQRHESPWRLIQSAIYNILFRIMFHVSYRDINGTPKLLSRRLYERIDLNSKDWFIDPEVMLKTHETGYPVGEVDITWRTCTEGTTHVRLSAIFEFLRHMLRYRYRSPQPSSYDDRTNP
jgi:glycosyltransferase involved in cell wall biosynthesis